MARVVAIPVVNGDAALRRHAAAYSAVPGYGVRMWNVAVSMPCSIAHSTVRSNTDSIVAIHAEDEAAVDHHAEVVQTADGRAVVAAQVLVLALLEQVRRVERLEADEEAAQAGIDRAFRGARARAPR